MKETLEAHFINVKKEHTNAKMRKDFYYAISSLTKIESMRMLSWKTDKGN